MNENSPEGISESKKTRAWKSIFAVWFLFIAIDILISGISYLLLNYVLVDLRRGYTYPDLATALIGILLAIYKFSAVPFYWLVLYKIAKKGSNKSILNTSLGKTVSTIVICFILAYLLNVIISLIFDPGRLDVHLSFVFELIFVASLISAVVSPVIWYHWKNSIWREKFDTSGSSED